jgi:hypothetical protein
MDKITEGLKLRGLPVEIPGTFREDLPQFFLNQGYKTGAEIGVFQGEFSESFCKAGLKHYAVDPWISYDDYPRGDKLMERRYQDTVRVLSPYKNCTIIRKTSLEAVEGFEDESLDYVYIDGNHMFRYVADDLFEWSKKVRSGGVVSGHDYALVKHTFHTLNELHVKYIVDAYVKAFDIPNFWILGQRTPPPGESRDKWRSWFWFNP